MPGFWKIFLPGALALTAAVGLFYLSNSRPVPQGLKTFTLAKSFRTNYCFHSQVNFQGIDLSHKKFHVCIIQNSKMPNVAAEWSEWKGVTLLNTSLEGSDLRNSSFLGSNIQNTSFARANLTGSTFESANISVSDFRGATMLGVKMKNSRLTLSEMSGAFFNAATELPFPKNEAIRRGMIYVE